MSSKDGCLQSYASADNLGSRNQLSPWERVNEGGQLALKETARIRVYRSRRRGQSRDRYKEVDVHIGY